ncbi:MAG TPA: NUDIX domain-containing protein [Candidatus Saccharimonadales bacterium]|nr:NUDIX domain-containing protein [Candidatus Saccharimonadales bacterium]
MKAHSAGLVVYRMKSGQPEVLMAHMGAPWWAKKDIGAWTIPKGGIDKGEEPLAAAKREFTEELGLPLPEGEYSELGDIEQHNNKTVTAWAVEADFDVKDIKSNTFKAEWPPKSGQQQEFPEIDRAAWMSLPEATQKAVPGQAALFEKLADILHIPFGSEEIPPASKQGSLF